MPTDSRWRVIVNPASGRPDGGAGWRAIDAALRDAGIAFDVVHTERPGHGSELARAALVEGCRRIAVAGGDGSVNEAVQGIMGAGLADTREVTLAVIPTGTGNDWARTLGIGRRPAGIAQALARGRTMLHDVGAIDLPGRTLARRWFINVAGAGAAGAAAAGYTAMSLYQQYAIGVRMILPTSWGLTRANAVAGLDGVAW